MDPTKFKHETLNIVTDISERVKALGVGYDIETEYMLFVLWKEVMRGVKDGSNWKLQFQHIARMEFTLNYREERLAGYLKKSYGIGE